MKKTIQIFAVVISAVLLSSFAPIDKSSSLPTGKTMTFEEPYYVFLTIDGVWSKQKKAYLSKILYYPGYKACDKEGYRFVDEATAAFRTYLKAEYSDAFPYNVNDIISWSGQVNSSASANDLKTRQQAEESVRSWVAKQKKDGNTVIYTDFSYSCEKD